jgi:multicomponent Na+:H+ antiporter subunit B
MWASLVLLTMLVAVMVGVMRSASTMTAIILMSAYSLVAALWFLLMDAPDVAFTEAVVGAGVSTVVLLGAALLTRTRSAKRSMREDIARGWPAALAVLVAGGVLVYASAGLPGLGDPTSPANTHVGRAYLERTGAEIGVPNVVTAVLASYRGFDTLGETAVIFAAAIGVALMLGFGERALADLPSAMRSPQMEALAESDHHVVLRTTTKLLIPVITLYAFYVQFHGDLGPGGGFQAGVILSVAVILHALVFGLADTMEALPAGVVRGAAAFGVLAYAGVGFMTIVNGGGFLDYAHFFPPGFEEREFGAHSHWGQHLGILAVESGVMLTVAATMCSILYGFAGRAPDLAPVAAPGAVNEAAR